MNRPKLISSIILFFSICLICVTTTLAQNDTKPQIEPNYEAILHVLLGSGDASQSSVLPQSLSGVSKQLNTNFAFSNYKLINTYFGRVANSGNLDYKSISNIYGVEQPESDSPSFLDWRLVGLKAAQADSGRAVFQITSFRFGARVPLKIGSFKDETGKSQSTINYESLGLSLDKLSVPENVPTLIGTLSLPKTTGTVFLVLIVKSVEN